MVFSFQILGSGRLASSGRGLSARLWRVLPALLLLAACGQKGPLFIPVPPKAAAIYVAPPASAPLLAPPLVPASGTK